MDANSFKVTHSKFLRCYVNSLSQTLTIEFALWGRFLCNFSIWNWT